MSRYSMEELLAMVKEEASKANIKKVTSAENIFELLYEYADKEQEHFMVVTLDGASNVIEKRVIHIGTVNNCMVSPREIFRSAILDNAAAIIVSHNHPSGTLSPGSADKVTTQRLKDAGKILGIELLDHVIITKEGYYSFADEGLM